LVLNLQKRPCQVKSESAMRKTAALILILFGFAAGPVTAHEPILTLRGAVANGEASFDRAALRALGMVDVRTRTEWTEGRPVFSGPRLAAVLDAAQADGERLRAVALNDYAVEIPIEDARRFDVILALEQDGAPLSVRMKGPIWVIYPWDDDPALDDPIYNSRSIWQLKAIDVR